MHIIAMVLCLMVSVAAHAQVPVDPPMAMTYHQVYVEYHNAYPTTNQSKIATAVFRGSGIEVGSEKGSLVKAICFEEPMFHITRGGGYIVEVRSNRTPGVIDRWYAPWSNIKWCFPTEHSYRFWVSRVVSGKDLGKRPGLIVSTCTPMGFKIAQGTPVATDPEIWQKILGKDAMRCKASDCVEHLGGDVAQKLDCPRL